MGWNLDKNRPICPQICEQICVKIAVGELGPNERLLSVRDVAVVAGVNPNTVQKSFEQLEQQGLIYSVRGSGWFVGENADLARETVRKLISDKTKTYFDDMWRLGLNSEQVKDYIKEWDS